MSEIDPRSQINHLGHWKRSKTLDIVINAIEKLKGRQEICRQIKGEICKFISERNKWTQFSI